MSFSRPGGVEEVITSRRPIIQCPTIDFKNGFGAIWKERPGRHKKDKYWNGPSNFPRAGQRVDYTLGFDYCALGLPVCTAKKLYYGKQIGSRGYYDLWRK